MGAAAPVAALMVLSPMLAELPSGAMRPTDFLSPMIFFPFTIVVYGLPVLALREIAARLGLGATGLWVLGMVYGVFNEGLFSETFYYPLESSLPEFAGYGLVGDLQVPWMTYILPWHGLFSVLLPVMVVDRLFPRRSGRPWFSAKTTVVLTAVTAALGLARFILNGEDITVHSGSVFAFHLAVLCLLAAALSVAAVRLPRTPRMTPGQDGRARLWRSFAVGAGLYAAGFLGMVFLASAGAPWLLPVAYGVAAVLAVVWASTRVREVKRSTVLAFTLGCLALEAAVIPLFVQGILAGDAQSLATGAVVAAAAAFAMVRLGGRSGLSARTAL